MLDRTLLAGDETSRFFQHNDRLAKTWESLSKALQGEIAGQVNGQIMEFKLKFLYNNKPVEVDGIRQMSNINAGKSTGFAMQKNTIISISDINYGNESWKIYQRHRIIDFFNRITKKFQVLKYDGDYAVVSSKRVNQNSILTMEYFKYISNFAELRSVEYKGGTLRVEYFNLLSADLLIKLVKDILR